VCAAWGASSAPNLLRRVGASPTVAGGVCAAFVVNSAPNLLRRVGTSPTVAGGVCAAFAMSSTPNLLRRVGTSPTVAAACARRGGRLAHQTCCDVLGQAQPSRWRARAEFVLSSAPNLLRRVGASPTVAGACTRARGPTGFRRCVSNAKLGLVP